MSEKRKASRRRTSKGARIVFDNGRSTILCALRDVSDDGARLHVGSAVGIPNQFRLFVSDELDRTCHVVRRTFDEIGVRFAEVESPSATTSNGLPVTPTITTAASQAATSPAYLKAWVRKWIDLDVQGVQSIDAVLTMLIDDARADGLSLAELNEAAGGDTRSYLGSVLRSLVA